MRKSQDSLDIRPRQLARELCRFAQVVQSSCRAPASGPHTAARCERDRQGPGRRGRHDTAGAFLLVVGRDAYATYDLPASGALTIGRGESNAVRVDDPLASRAHACLHVGDAMFLEDVGSVNGTRVKDRVVKPGERVRITIGETIQIGSSVLIVQRRTAQADLIRPGDAARRGAADHPGDAVGRRARARRCAGCTSWPSAPPPARSTSSSPARPASARSCSPRPFTARPRGAADRTSASTARRCPRRCWRASCSATSAARSRAPCRRSWACWRRRRAGRCFSTRSASCLWRRRPSCCA